MQANRNGCTGPASLQDKLHTIIHESASNDAFLEALHSRPQLGDAKLSEFEMDLLDWGGIFGVAYGIARDENPWEAPQSCAERAFDVAWPVWLNWSGPFHERDRGEAASRVVREYHKLPDGVDVFKDHRDMEDALIDLSNTAGS